MHNGLRLTLYAVFILGGLFFGWRTLATYKATATDASRRFDHADAGLLPGSTEPAAARPALPAPSTNAVVSTNAPVVAGSTNTIGTTNAPAPDIAPATNAPAADAKSMAAARAGRRSHLGLYGALCFGCLVGFGLLLGHDVADYLAQRTHVALFNEDGVGTKAVEYEAAEQEWANGEYLEAVRLMREYLKKNPREQGVAIRIAEIYERDLGNPLAAALEYEEILTKKLPPERWGWAAIHLVNLYSGKLGQTEKAVALLRHLDAKYPDTAAAEKARQRLAAYDGTGPEPIGPVDESAAAPEGDKMPGPNT